MKFKSLVELADYLLTNDLNVHDLDVNVVDEKEEILDESVQSCTMENPVSLVESVNISSLGADPSIKFEIGDVPINELHVTEFDVLKDSCGVGNIQLCESHVYLNICNMEDETTTKMSVTVNETRFNNMELKLVESNEEKIVFSKDWVEENINSKDCIEENIDSKVSEYLSKDWIEENIN